MAYGLWVVDQGAFVSWFNDEGLASVSECVWANDARPHYIQSCISRLWVRDLPTYLILIPILFTGIRQTQTHLTNAWYLGIKEFPKKTRPTLHLLAWSWTNWQLWWQYKWWGLCLRKIGNLNPVKEFQALPSMDPISPPWIRFPPGKWQSTLSGRLLQSFLNYFCRLGGLSI